LLEVDGRQAGRPTGEPPAALTRWSRMAPERGSRRRPRRRAGERPLCLDAASKKFEQNAVFFLFAPRPVNPDDLDDLSNNVGPSLRRAISIR